MAETSQRLYRVALVEDQPALRRQLTRILSAAPGIAFLSGFASGEEALEPLKRLKPDVLLLDLELPGMSGLEVLAELKPRAPEIQVLILTTFEDDAKVYEAMRAGASGYLTKQASLSGLPAAVIEIAEGGTLISPQLARRFWNYFRGAQGGVPPSTAPVLTDLERELLTYFARGLSNAEVGRTLSIERRTVRTHLLHVYRKLGVHSHVEAVVEALRRGLITL